MGRKIDVCPAGRAEVGENGNVWDTYNNSILVMGPIMDSCSHTPCPAASLMSVVQSVTPGCHTCKILCDHSA